jgi:hypothetical protein
LAKQMKWHDSLALLNVELIHKPMWDNVILDALSRRNFKWKNPQEHFMRTCVKCQNMKSIYKKKYGLYKLLLIPNEPWESVSMDFMM